MDQIQAPPRILPAPSPLRFPVFGGEIPTSNFRGLRVHALFFGLDLFSSKGRAVVLEQHARMSPFFPTFVPCLPIFPSFVPLCCVACNLQPLLACHAVTPLRLRWFPPPCTVAHYPVGTFAHTGTGNWRGKTPWQLAGKKVHQKAKKCPEKRYGQAEIFYDSFKLAPGMHFLHDEQTLLGGCEY